MTTIQIRCPQCGTENSVPAGALLATVSAEDLDPDYAGTVAWICAGCDHVVSARWPGTPSSPCSPPG